MHFSVRRIKSVIICSIGDSAAHETVTQSFVFLKRAYESHRGATSNSASTYVQ